jgi:glutaconate CoA-transferase subunit B
MGFPGKGPTAVITDLGILTPDPATKELTLTSLHPGVALEKAVESTGWPLKVSPKLATTEAPTAGELRVLRELNERTARAHAGQA